MKARHLFIPAVLAFTAPLASAAFHQWKIQEVYSNNDGTVEFVEFFTTFNSENFLGGHKLTFDINVTQTNTYNFTTNLAPNTANKTFLVGTANLTALYGVTPDYVIPANFFTKGPSNFLNFENGFDKLTISGLPLDGVTSLNGLTADGNSANFTINSQATPKNYLGQTATIPEPGSTFLGGLGFAGFIACRRRRQVRA